MEELELWNLLVELEEGKINTYQAHAQILRLFSVEGRSEQLKCLMEDDKPNCNCELNHCLKKGW